MKTMLFLLTTSFALLTLPVKAQYITVSGYVTNFLTGGTIENATVYERHSEIGTISNKEGFYQLILHPGELNIMFSEDGFKSSVEQIEALRDTILIVRLKPEPKEKHSNNNRLQTDTKKAHANSDGRKFLFF